MLIAVYCHEKLYFVQVVRSNYRFSALSQWNVQNFTLSCQVLPFIIAVCKHAKKHCHFVVDAFKHCWQSEHGVEHPGQGIFSFIYILTTILARYKTFQGYLRFYINKDAKILHCFEAWMIHGLYRYCVSQRKKFKSYMHFVRPGKSFFSLMSSLPQVICIF